MTGVAPITKRRAHKPADRQITAGEYKDAIRETRPAVDAMRKLNIWPQNGSKKRDDQD
ncbi:hypothetical protein [Streptomyces sp. R08]|uniref:Integrase n=1 Tax=Streptomyces sp. R08 TaxID=3238624 RepID=A0AB39M0R0_9ACTN